MQFNYILIGALNKLIPFIPSHLMKNGLGGGEGNLLFVSSNK